MGDSPRGIIIKEPDDIIKSPVISSRRSREFGIACQDHSDFQGM